MRLLIDTHIVLWADERPQRIPSALLAAMRDENNEIVVLSGRDGDGTRDQKMRPHAVATLGLD